jgi:hypothetical protein
MEVRDSQWVLPLESLAWIANMSYEYHDPILRHTLMNHVERGLINGWRTIEEDERAVFTGHTRPTRTP